MSLIILLYAEEEENVHLWRKNNRIWFHALILDLGRLTPVFVQLELTGIEPAPDKDEGKHE
jgi:hypothetical protein